MTTRPADRRLRIEHATAIVGIGHYLPKTAARYKFVSSINIPAPGDPRLDSLAAGQDGLFCLGAFVRLVGVAANCPVRGILCQHRLGHEDGLEAIPEVELARLLSMEPRAYSTVSIRLATARLIAVVDVSLQASMIDLRVAFDPTHAGFEVADGLPLFSGSSDAATRIALRDVDETRRRRNENVDDRPDKTQAFHRDSCEKRPPTAAEAGSQKGRPAADTCAADLVVHVATVIPSFASLIRKVDSGIATQQERRQFDIDRAAIGRTARRWAAAGVYLDRLDRAVEIAQQAAKAERPLAYLMTAWSREFPWTREDGNGD